VTNPFFFWSLMMIVYYVAVGAVIGDGYFRSLIGHSHGSGHSHSKLHIVLWQIHSGMHVNPNRSYGDEARLKRAAGATNRATPEGAIVYFTRWKRGRRALRNNAIVWAFLSSCFGLVAAPGVTVNVLVVALILGITAWIAWMVQKARKRARDQPARKIAKTLPSFRPGARAVPRVDTPQLFRAQGTVVEAKPKLDGGIPTSVMAVLLSEPIGCSPMETSDRLTIGADMGTLALPDTFPALEKQKEHVQDIIRAQTGARLQFTWSTSSVPRTVSWVPVVRSLPGYARFRDYLPQMEKLPHGDFGVGLDTDHEMYVASHRGETPWILRSASPGTGKSTAFQVKLAQICHRDPRAEVYCVDTKQVSFHDMHGIPGVHIYEDPVTGMGQIYKLFFTLHKVMLDRYTAVRTHQASYEDFDDIWLLIDEGNDLATNLRTYYTNEIKETGGPAQPPVWSEAIEPIRNLGRQVHIRGEWMFQNMTDKALGGISLRDGWGEIGMAGYNRNQFGRIIGNPYEEPKGGVGRILMVRGNKRTWVQGFHDEPEYLRNYALVGRR
jgi:hypothetical protein